MLRFDDETHAIYIIAKDTGAFVIDISNYLLADGDRAYFTVNDQLEKQNPRIQKLITEFPNNKLLVQLSSVDTDIPVGDYYYDVQVNAADGRVDTIIGPYKFKVLGGVKY